MTRDARCRLAVALALGAGVAFAALRPACAAEGVKAAMGTAPAGSPQEKFRADPVALTSPSQTAVFDAENGRVTISTLQGGRPTKRAEAAFGSLKRFKSYKLLHTDNPPRRGVEVYSEASKPEFTLLLSEEGVFEFRPGQSQRLVLRDLRCHYGLVPSLIGADFLFDAQMRPQTDRLHIPSMNMVIGLVEGGDCLAVGVWPPGKQAASFVVKQAGKARLLDALAIDTAGQSFYFSCLQKPGIWHAEPLKPSYLEKDTVIGWKRPFEAKWIGRFFIASDEYHWPFYFRHDRAKLWGRYVRGWFYYPVWFDGDKTLIHFEKHFPPQGELLIYYLEPHPTRPDRSPGSPVGVMEQALGKEQAARLLDFDGTVEKTLLEHRQAVCAMTNTMQKWFDAGEETQRRAEIERWCDDVSAFIGMIRARVNEFGALARELKAMLAAEVKVNPDLGGAVAELEPTLTAIEQSSKNDLPPTSLETVRRWTDEMKGLAAEVKPGNKKRYEKLGAQCRSVAGTQDDLARALSVLAIRLTEQAARQGVPSPQHARLAEEVIAKTRQVLRAPTWWEPCRRYEPKSDPGRR
jgi:hypothetical protein